jgi:outer membrane immunogenic protein
MRNVGYGGFAACALVVIAPLTCSMPASAADMPVKAPPSAAPIYEWTGFYAGGNLGYSVGRNHSSERNSTNLVFSAQSFTLGPAGGLAGGQIGYNWQPAVNWVFGIEADWQWTGQKDSVCITTCGGAGGATGFSLTVEQKLHWFATLRGRIGYARDGWLWYVTGGGAWGGVTENDELLQAGILTTARFAQTKGGWTLGGGIETALAGNWSAKLEYLYVDLGSTTDSLRFLNEGIPDTQTISKAVRDHLIRLGLNYRFGGSSAADPVRAKTARAVYKAPSALATSNWTGFYLGGNVGYGVGRNHGSETASGLANTTQSFALGPAGGLAGGQIGYNWQPAANWLLGIEADWQWTGQEDLVCVSQCTIGRLTVEQKLHWLATLRGRIGYAREGWLWYVTGGGAWGRVTENDAVVSVGQLTAASFSHTKGGWTVGSGVETALAGNWSAKLEYLFVDLGSTTDAFAFNAVSTETITKQVRDHIFRVGLNYRFGGPVAARH